MKHKNILPIHDQYNNCNFIFKAFHEIFTLAHMPFIGYLKIEDNTKKCKRLYILYSTIYRTGEQDGLFLANDFFDRIRSC